MSIYRKTYNKCPFIGALVKEQPHRLLQAGVYSKVETPEPDIN